MSLAPDFLAIETTAYDSRRDLLDRLKLVLESLSETFRPADVQRLGLRYIDRLTDEGYERVQELLVPEVLGIARLVEGGPAFSRAVRDMLTQAYLEADEGTVTARRCCPP